jgi:hypothetical protein
MSDKTVISFFIVVVILIAGWLFFFKAGDDYIKEETVKGTISKVDLSQTRVDGPILVTVQTKKGLRTLEIRTESLENCPSFRNIADAFWLNVGENVEAKGQVKNEGLIEPCVSENHYFRIIADSRR